jgi:hypothetical protein
MMLKLQSFSERFELKSNMLSSLKCGESIQSTLTNIVNKASIPRQNGEFFIKNKTSNSMSLLYVES